MVRIKTWASVTLQTYLICACSSPDLARQREHRGTVTTLGIICFQGHDLNWNSALPWTQAQALCLCPISWTSSPCHSNAQRIIPNSMICWCDSPRICLMEVKVRKWNLVTSIDLMNNRNPFVLYVYRIYQRGWVSNSISSVHLNLWSTCIILTSRLFMATGQNGSAAVVVLPMSQDKKYTTIWKSVIFTSWLFTEKCASLWDESLETDLLSSHPSSYNW